MKTLLETIKEAEENKIAIGHFNFSDEVGFLAIVEAANEIGVPVILGTSEGERDFFGVNEAVAVIRAEKEKGAQVFLNADHTHSLEKVKEAVQAGYDSIIFDGSKLELQENILKTREAVQYIKSVNPNILVEGELGYIGSSSEILKDKPVDLSELTTPEDAKRFVEETGVDFFAPAVGNLHGMFKDAPNPRLDIERIRAIKKAVQVPLVLHGGSGILDEDFVSAIEAGISIIHINTEIRLAWKKTLQESLEKNFEEVAPYKIFSPVKEAVKNAVKSRLILFSKKGM